MAHRYAVYLTPDPAHPLWRAGCEWLGRHPFEPHAPGQEPPAGRRQPSRYGFHATLKAPMRLAPGLTESDWLRAVQALADAWGPFECPALTVSRLGDSLALRPEAPVGSDHALWRLARDCVTDLDLWRAPLSQSEWLYRCAKTVLDEEQRALLMRWGYPHVLHRWHWHFTLTDRAPDRDQLAIWHHEAQQHFAQALAQPMRVTALNVFVEEAPGEPLTALRRFELPVRPPLDGSPLEVQNPRPIHGAAPVGAVPV